MARVQYTFTFTNAQPGATVNFGDVPVFSSASDTSADGPRLVLDSDNTVTVWSDAATLTAATVDGRGEPIAATATKTSPTVTTDTGTAGTSPFATGTSVPVPADGDEGKIVTVGDPYTEGYVLGDAPSGGGGAVVVGEVNAIRTIAAGDAENIQFDLSEIADAGDGYLLESTDPTGDGPGFVLERNGLFDVAYSVRVATSPSAGRLGIGPVNMGVTSADIVSLFTPFDSDLDGNTVTTVPRGGARSRVLIFNEGDVGNRWRRVVGLQLAVDPAATGPVTVEIAIYVTKIA